MLTYQMGARGSTPKYEYLYDCIKQDILGGTLKAGERLPSRRTLAEHLGVSVVTVETAYGMLQDEGYISARDRSGYYVEKLALLSGMSVRTMPPAAASVPSPGAQDSSRKPGAQDRAGRTEAQDRAGGTEVQGRAGGTAAQGGTGRAEAQGRAREPAAQDNSSGTPAQGRARKPGAQDSLFSASDFPVTPYLRIIRSVLADYRDRLTERPPNAGCPELRRAISAYLGRYRGMKVLPEQIIIGSGSEYLYGLVAQLFNGGIIFGLESQSYEKIRLVYRAYRIRCELLPMDRYGISSEGLAGSQAGLLHVTPFHSYPTGITAPAAKRYEYIQWASRRKAFIVEDDFASEFLVERRPLETLYAMDRTESVIYLNTFTRTIAPSMRVAYMVLPVRLLGLYEKKLGFYSCTVPSLDQYVLAEYIDRGYLEKRLNRVRRELRQKSAGK